MSTPVQPKAREEYQATVAAYVAAGGDASVQRVITAIFSLTKKLDQWYDRQLADLGITHGDWSVLAHLARRDGGPATPSQLADAANVAASSMTNRLVLVTLTDAGWDLFATAIREANVVESDTLASLSRGQRTELASLLEIVISGLDDLDPHPMKPPPLP